MYRDTISMLRKNDVKENSPWNNRECFTGDGVRGLFWKMGKVW